MQRVHSSERVAHYERNGNQCEGGGSPGWLAAPTRLMLALKAGWRHMSVEEHDRPRKHCKAGYRRLSTCFRRYLTNPSTVGAMPPSETDVWHA